MAKIRVIVLIVGCLWIVCGWAWFDSHRRWKEEWREIEGISSPEEMPDSAYEDFFCSLKNSFSWLFLFLSFLLVVGLWIIF